MPTFRKKPVEVEARRNDSTSALHAQQLAEWCGGRARKNELDHGSRIEITTLEGVMTADLGDWIIKEPFPTADRQFYPCKPDIFEATYEPAV